MTIHDPGLIDALRNAAGTPVTVVDPQTQTEHVVVRADVYERIKSLFEADDLSSDEKLMLLAESGKRAGWDSAQMDEYDAHRS
jgi:hypothetical protein